MNIHDIFDFMASHYHNWLREYHAFYLLDIKRIAPKENGSTEYLGQNKNYSKGENQNKLQYLYDNIYR